MGVCYDKTRVFILITIMNSWTIHYYMIQYLGLFIYCTVTRCHFCIQLCKFALLSSMFSYSDNNNSQHFLLELNKKERYIYILAVCFCPSTFYPNDWHLQPWDLLYWKSWRATTEFNITTYHASFAKWNQWNKYLCNHNMFT